MDEELELARAFAAREAWAYDLAYRRHGSVLYAAARQVLRDDREAQDCVHDVLLRLWRSGSTYRSERGTLRAFLATCVRNEALSRVRKSGNRARIEQTFETPDGAAKTEGDVGETVAARESVRRALAGLSDKQRESVVMAYYRQFTLVEIAHELSEPVGTIKSRLSSALQNLRKAFASEESAHVGS